MVHGGTPSPLEAFTANYVRSVVKDRNRRARMERQLEYGLPYVEETFAAVAMLDISGYSSLTSLLAKQGKISSEVISDIVRNYLSKLINIVAFYDGDVIKFLGDAVLVTFTERHANESRESIVRRGLRCCTHALRFHSKFELDVSRFGGNLGDIASNPVDAAANAKDPKAGFASLPRSATATNTNGASTIPRSSVGARGVKAQPSLTLRLHVGLTAGVVKRMIIGSLGDRLDYCVDGDCVKHLETLLESAKAGELGVHVSALEGVVVADVTESEAAAGGASSKPVVMATATATGGGGAGVKQAAVSWGKVAPAAAAEADQQPALGCVRVLDSMVVLEPAAICGLHVAFAMAGSKGAEIRLSDVMALARSWMKAGVLSMTAVLEEERKFGCGAESCEEKIFVMIRGLMAAASDGIVGEDDLTGLGQLSQFVNKSVLHKLQVSGGAAREHGASVTSASSESLTVHRNGTLGSANPTNQRSLSVFSSSAGPSTSAQFIAEFRTVTVMFVKFHTRMDATAANEALKLYLKVARACDGVFQQFSYDDKGASMLCFWGLPPHAHENNARFAVKAAIEFAESYTGNGDDDASIGVATGDLLFSKLGNEIRSEASFLGDVVNVAARLLSIKSDYAGAAIVDEVTHESTKDTFFHVDIGEHMVKGKAEPLHLWAVMRKESSAPDVHRTPGPGATSKTFGYQLERQFLTSALQKWKHERKGLVAVFEGPIGCGKSKLIDFVVQHAGQALDLPVCLTRGSEVDEWTPCYGLHALVAFCLSRLGSMEAGRGAVVPDKTAAKVALRAAGSLTSLIRPKGPPSRGSSVHMLGAGKLRTSQPTLSARSSVSSVHGPLRQMMAVIGEPIENLVALKAVLPEEMIPGLMGKDSLEKSRLLESIIVKLLNEIRQPVDSTVCILLFTRPFADFPQNLLQRATEMSQAVKFKMNGFTREEIEEYMAWRFEEQNIKSIDSYLLN
ncbi:hypothetical protein HK101_000922, partial [Irineochytrium annulatum]